MHFTGRYWPVVDCRLEVIIAVFTKIGNIAQTPLFKGAAKIGQGITAPSLLKGLLSNMTNHQMAIVIINIQCEYLYGRNRRNASESTGWK